MEVETLRNLIVGETGLTASSIPQLNKCLQNKRFMTQIILDNNRIGVQGAMTDLRMANCNIEEDGAVAIS
jgi:dihydrodipicolinate reductase